MVCLGDEQRSFCLFWDCIQVLHFWLFCWLWWLLHFFWGIPVCSCRYNGHLSLIHPFQYILVHWFLDCWHSLLPFLFDHFQFVLIHGPDIPGPYAILLFTTSDLASITSHIHNRDQIANIRWIMVKAREFQKNIYFCFIDYAKAFDCVDHNKLWKILQEMGIPDHLTCLLRNLYAGQEAAIRTGHGTTDGFK